MAQTAIWGTDASVTVVGFGCHFNAFDLQLAQGITSFFGFGDLWMTNHGTINSWSGSLAGFTTYGTTTDSIEGATSTTDASTILVRGGQSSTVLTWKTGNNYTGTTIITSINAALNFLGTPTSSYSFVGSGAPNVTWTTS